MKNIFLRPSHRGIFFAFVVMGWNLCSFHAEAQELVATKATLSVVGVQAASSADPNSLNPAVVTIPNEVASAGGSPAVPDPNSLNPAVVNITNELVVEGGAPSPPDPNSLNPAVEDITNEAGAQGAAARPATQVLAGRESLLDKFFSRGSPFYYGLTFGETFDDNIFIAPTNRHADLITHVSPSIDFVEGDKVAANMNYFNVVFQPTLYFYNYNSGQNRVDYFADALYQHSWTRFTLSLEQRFDELSGPDIDVGNFFKRQIYTTTLRGSYWYNDHLSFAGSETQRISEFQNLGISSTSEWITDAYANYQIAPKTTVGVGPRFGFVDIAGEPGQTYQDLLFRLAYHVSEKVNVNFDGGAEYRQFQGAPSRIFPVFDLNAGYTPFDGTQLSFSAYRQEVISYGDVGGDYQNTVAQANLKQRFLGKFFFLASVAYNLADYQQINGQGAAGGRTDNYYFLDAGLEWDPREFMSVSARYQYSEDDSTFAENSFTDTQIDLQAALQF